MNPRVGAAGARERRSAAPDVDDLQPAGAPAPGNIPWGYGHDRVTAMARDPDWLFVYWELTDDALARARAEVRDPDAACILRLYDTTYRVFDGANANWSMDVAVHRPANNHYVLVSRPGATFHVDIGVKSAEGRFATIVRSAPVEAPRDSISPDARVEWMTVTPPGRPPEYEHRFSPASGPGASRVTAPLAAREIEQVMQAFAGAEWSRTEWSEADMGGRRVRWVRWSGPWRRDARVEILFEGGRRVVPLEHGERVVLGPWRVTIRAFSPGGGSRVIDRWTARYSWVTAAGAVRIETGPIIQRILRAYRTALVPTGSEARLIGESGASEALAMAASEWRWIGASEAWLAGASEILSLAASEFRFLGASELLSLGASEMRPLGASGALFAGASALGGASEMPGASRAPSPSPREPAP